MQEKNYQESISTAFELLNNDQVEQALEIFTDVFSNTEESLALFGMASCAYNRKDYVAALTQLHELISQPCSMLVKYLKWTGTKPRRWRYLGC